MSRSQATCDTVVEVSSVRHLLPAGIAIMTFIFKAVINSCYHQFGD